MSRTPTPAPVPDTEPPTETLSGLQRLAALDAALAAYFATRDAHPADRDAHAAALARVRAIHEQPVVLRDAEAAMAWTNCASNARQALEAVIDARRTPLMQSWVRCDLGPVQSLLEGILALASRYRELTRPSTAA